MASSNTAMISRAEQLADSVFFPHCFVYQDLVFTRLPVFFDLSHRLLFDRAQNSGYCSCLMHPKPCMHVLAFEQFISELPDDRFETVGQLPDWALALKNGTVFIEKTKSGAAATSRTAQQNQRRLERLERAEFGFQDLETWLLDTLHHGLATAISEDPDLYKSIAGRLADASMRGISRNLRLLDTLPKDHPDWANQSLATLADAALALQAFRSRHQLPQALIDDLEAYIGIALKKETVLAESERLKDRWAVTGILEEEVENQLRLRRTWLLGAQTSCFALLLEYVHGYGSQFLPGMKPGTILEGELVFYPSAWPQRALIPNPLQTLDRKVKQLPGFETLDAMADANAAALGKQPWLAQFPVVLNAVTVFTENNKFKLCDTQGKTILLAGAEQYGWSLLALGGGNPISVFGEWSNQSLLVLSAISEERFVVF